MRATIVGTLILDSSKVKVQKAERKRTQLLFADMLHMSFFVETSELLVYLENLTEQVRLIDADQNRKEL